jgi:hypothetical protein
MRYHHRIRHRPNREGNTQVNVPTLVIPITQVIDRETQSVVALASTPEKAVAMIAALKARPWPANEGEFYQEDPLPIDLLTF